MIESQKRAPFLYKLYIYLEYLDSDGDGINDADDEDDDNDGVDDDGRYYI